MRGERRLLGSSDRYWGGARGECQVMRITRDHGGDFESVYVGFSSTSEVLGICVSKSGMQYRKLWDSTEDRVSRFNSSRTMALFTRVVGSRTSKANPGSLISSLSV